LVFPAGIAAAQELSPHAVRSPEARSMAWEFGPVRPHVRDAAIRSGSALIGATLLMGIGLGFEQINEAACKGSLCTAKNTVQTGVSFAFLGALAGAVGRQLNSKCNRSGRAVLGIVGAIAGAAIAGAIADVRLLNSSPGDPATFRTMGTGLLGLSLGAGIATAIC
jgi:hypothetical protein